MPQAIFYLLVLEIVLFLASRGEDRRFNVVKMRSLGIAPASAIGRRTAS